MDGFQQAAPDRATVQPGVPARTRRIRLRPILLVLLGIAAGSAGGYYGHRWWTTGRFVEETDDAYTQADAVTIAPRVSGTINDLVVTDNQLVRAGQVLARIDDRDYRAAVAQAEADIAAAQADIGNLDAQITLQQASIAQATADIASAQAALDFARADYARYMDLMRTGNGTVQRAQQADTDIRSKTAALARSRAALEAAQQQVHVLQAQRTRTAAALARAEATAQQAKLNLSYTTIAAPVDGAVGDRSVRLGQYVQPGTKLLDVVPVGRAIYVVANFKETQLDRMWRGEHADISVDMLPGITLHGQVDSLAPGSGAQFALLPPENATGNFTKIVQRVPVKIVLDGADQATLAKLRPGLSVIASVDTRTRPEGPLQTLVGETGSGSPAVAARAP
ncbi:MAG: HlyD family secretion protein [Acetobacteraceae bacterium]|nr:HlyD family secretion protein [Acetobacteraceae bacterium]